MSDLMLKYLIRKAAGITRLFLLLLVTADDRCERPQTIEHKALWQTPVYEAGYLVYACCTHFSEPIEGIFYRTEQSAIFEITLEGKFENCIEFLSRQGSEIYIWWLSHSRRLLECRKCPSILLDQRRRAFKIIF